MLLILIQVALAERIFTPVIRHVYEQIPHTFYSPNVNSTLLLQYNSYPGVYSMELGEIIDGNYFRIHPNVTLDPFTLPGCNQYERRLIYKHLANQSTQSPNAFLTNMYIDDNLVFVTRSDNSILTFEIVLDILDRSVNDLKLKSIQTTHGSSLEHHIACFNKTCAVFGQDSAFLYKDPDFQLIDLEKNIQGKGSFPIKIYFDEKLNALYLIYGTNLVEVYQFTETSLIRFTSFTAGQQIVSVRTNPESTMLYLLDNQAGLLFYKILSIGEYVDTGFMIALKNCQQFDFYQNTFFLVAETTDSIPYALEVLVNEDSYYFNKIYSKDMDIFDVWVGEHIAILIGSEVHRVIYHSVYNKFISESETPLFFQDIDLMNVEEFRKWESTQYTKNAIEQDPFSKTSFQYKQFFMVGISSQQLSIFSIKSISPWLQCKPISTNTTQYYLKMNATNCPTKIKENDHSAFKQCIIMHNFTLAGKEIYFYEQDQMTVIIGGCVLIGFVLLLIIAVVCVKKYLDNRIEFYILQEKQHVRLEELEPETIPSENVIV
ncbi:unnamed protein product [Paramecium pentaurelia]|uniref:Transmembrane protein n=1 Tax=Paramecium pentaurelia TaxID=43138 RepID=A0A8S1X7J3_9CILI|nr:unnamed protein product [Paramecium pentaurelia]